MPARRSSSTRRATSRTGASRSPAWAVPAGHWGRETVWAPEVHRYQGKYYLFVTLTSSDTLPTPEGVRRT